ncbi:HCO3- transporter family domain-containing protein [Ditylenchus destructor]|uniref:HCO3- transporter family domain-containing protein n=1 Tax=Ditylenchus destructor TaxID=166010 RepID=A0AAD4N6T5_9BILA|nr:HCO3- transporter family domain-containing protein [Ditylenchus destructor]
MTTPLVTSDSAISFEMRNPSENTASTTLSPPQSPPLDTCQDIRLDIPFTQPSSPTPAYPIQSLAFQNQHHNQFLMDRRQRLLSWKDFSGEVRALLDVQHLLSKSSVLLDVHDSDLRAILRRMVEELPVDRRSSSPSKPILYPNIHNKLFSIADVDHFRVTNIEQRIQSIIASDEGVFEDQSWFTLYCTSEDVVETRLCFARLHKPTNFGPGLGDVQFIVLVIGPIQQKDTKSALETARTFATLFADSQLRNELLLLPHQPGCEAEFFAAIEHHAQKLSQHTENQSSHEHTEPSSGRWIPGKGIIDDFKRRIVHYKSDYLDGIANKRSIQKTISSAVFLYFSILPTAVALGMLNDTNTNGKINVNKEILSQWIGGLFFGLFGGQLFLIMLSTAPISIYITVIQQISVSTGYDFFKLYTLIGLWCAFFLAVFAVCEASVIMKFARRSLEELFGLFIALALLFEAMKALFETFDMYDPRCAVRNSSFVVYETDPFKCERAVGLIFLVLLCGTVWLSVSLNGFRTTPYLTKAKRELLSDYALPIGVIIMALVSNIWFSNIPQHSFSYNAESSVITLSKFWELPISAHLICVGLGFPLAILFFMDQMIVTNTVDNNENNLQKGAAPNWDVLVVSVMNAILSLLGLPWMHGALPQAFLHLRSQADVEDRLVDGTIQQVIVKNRESRLATMIAHGMMVPTYFFLLPYLRFFPTSVFHGLFLYLAYSSTVGNEFCQRISLLFTEQRSYPPYHYNRRVPQRVIHTFTLIELIQLAVLFCVGFAPWPVVQLLFPIVTFLFIPFRSLILTRFISQKHLEILDGVH